MQSLSWAGEQPSRVARQQVIVNEIKRYHHCAWNRFANAVGFNMGIDLESLGFS